MVSQCAIEIIWETARARESEVKGHVKRAQTSESVQSTFKTERKEEKMGKKLQFSGKMPLKFLKLKNLGSRWFHILLF